MSNAFFCSSQNLPCINNRSPLFARTTNTSLIKALLLSRTHGRKRHLTSTSEGDQRIMKLKYPLKCKYNSNPLDVKSGLYWTKAGRIWSWLLNSMQWQVKNAWSFTSTTLSWLYDVVFRQRHRITEVIWSEARPPLAVLVRQLLVHSCKEYRLNILNRRYVRTKILFRDSFLLLLYSFRAEWKGNS